jgi:hypothetical protein
MKGVGHVARMGGEDKCTQGFCGEIEEELEDANIEKRLF